MEENEFDSDYKYRQSFIIADYNFQKKQGKDHV